MSKVTKHPVIEAIGCKLHGIGRVPAAEQERMVIRACKVGAEMYDAMRDERDEWRTACLMHAGCAKCQHDLGDDDYLHGPSSYCIPCMKRAKSGRDKLKAELAEEKHKSRDRLHQRWDESAEYRRQIIALKADRDALREALRDLIGIEMLADDLRRFRPQDRDKAIDRVKQILHATEADLNKPQQEE